MWNNHDTDNYIIILYPINHYSFPVLGHKIRKFSDLSLPDPSEVSLGGGTGGCFGSTVICFLTRNVFFGDK